MTRSAKIVATALGLGALGCGDLATSTGPLTALQQLPPAVMITGRVFLNGVPATDWEVELIGFLDSRRTAFTPLGTKRTDANGQFMFSLQPERHHCGRMSAQARPPTSIGIPPTALDPPTGTHFPIPCGTTDGLDFHFATAP